MTRISAKQLPGPFDVAALLLAAFTVFWPFHLRGAAANFLENGPVEGLQWTYLLAAVILFLLALRRPGAPTRLSLCGIALFCFNLFIRETNVRGTWAEPYLGAVFTDNRIFYLVALLWIPVVVLALRRFRDTAGELIRWLTTPAGISMLVGCILFVAGELAEKHWFSRKELRTEPIEETLELFAGYAILLAGYLTLRPSLSKPPGGSTRR